MKPPPGEPRRSELKRSGFIERHEPLPKSNRRRAKERKAITFGEHAVYIRTLPCCIGRDCFGVTEAAHVRSRGAGGTAKDLVPLCAKHHWWLHQMGIRTFQHDHGVALAAIAAELWAVQEDR